MTRVVHLKKEPFDIRIDRASIFGNMFSHKKDTKALVIVGSVKEAVDSFRSLLEDGQVFLEVSGIERNSDLWNELMRRRSIILESLPMLKDKVLGCWCKHKPDSLCHGDVYIELTSRML